MPRKKFWKRSKSKRPGDVFKESCVVYKLKPKELQSLKLLKRLKPLELHKSFVYNMTVETFEITYTRGSKTFSLFRSRSIEVADDVFSTFGPKIRAIMKGASDSTSPKLMKQLLFSIARCCREFRSWEASHIAAFLGLHNVFEDRVADVVERLNAQDDDRRDTPLHIALESNHPKTVKAILSLHPKLDLSNGQGNLVLHQAALTSKSQFRTIWSALGKQAFIMMNWRNNDNCTPFHLACYANKKSIVKMILSLGLTVRQMIVSPPDEIRDDTSGDSDEKDVDNNVDPTDRFSFTKEMIHDLDMTEINLGGSPMHWVRSRRTLEKLLILGLDPESKNLNGESVLHILTRKRRFRCLMAILVTNHRIVNATDKNGETALHLAVQTEDIPIVQAIIAFDVDINAVNIHGQSSRHLVSLQKSQYSNIILYMLNSLGATRCPEGFIGCDEGCKTEGLFSGVRWSKWCLFEGQSLYKTELMEGIIQSAIQEQTTSEENNDKQRKIRMLTLDGGGIRGLISITILCELSTLLRYPLFNYFDWTFGTSTGSLICSLLCLKHSPQDIRSLYFRFKDKIASRKPYSSKAFDHFLQCAIGESRVMNVIRRRKLAITSTLADRIPSQLHLFRSYPSPQEIIQQKDRELKCEQQYMWAACRASGSAPLYFQTYKNFIDGGVIANNPTLDGLTEYFNWREAMKLRGENPPDLGVLINIGTGKIPTVDLGEPINILQPLFSINLRKTAKNVKNLWSLLKVMYEQCTLTDRQVIERSMAWCASTKIPHFRLCPPSGGTVPLDVTDDEEIVNLIYETKAYVYAMRDEISKLATLLDYGDTPNEDDQSYSSLDVMIE